MPAVKSSLVHPAYKTEYRVRNWRDYEQGLRARGDVTIWFSEKAIANWISRDRQENGFVDGLQLIDFSDSCHPSYKILAPFLAGLTPAEHASFIGHTLS